VTAGGVAGAAGTGFLEGVWAAAGKVTKAAETRRRVETRFIGSGVRKLQERGIRIGGNANAVNLR